MTSEYKPPLRARLHWYRLSSAERALLTAMCEHCSDGSTVWASLSRLSAYSDLTVRHIYNLIHGRNRNGHHVPGLLDRHILSELAPANRGKKRPATYRINECALEEKPRMARYLTAQRQAVLPGIRRPSVPGETVELQPVDTMSPTPREHRNLVPVTPVTGSGAHRQLVPITPEPGSADSKTLDSRSGDPKTKIQHGDAALNTMPAWLAFKDQLRAEISDEEWDLWVDPMRLLKTMPAGKDQKHILAAIPPNGRIQSAALKRLPLMRELLAPAGLNISLTRYPDEWQIEEAKKRYGVDIAPKPWERGA